MNNCEFLTVSLNGGPVIARKIRRASTLISRARGLLGVKYLDEDEGVLITPCSSIHTLGMSIPIDILFLDCHSRVRKITESVPAGRVLLGPRGTVNTLELAAGSARRCGLHEGDRLVIDNTPLSDL